MGSPWVSVKMGAHSSRQGLARDDLEFLEHNTSYDKDTICDFYKGFMADCPEGKLTPATFCEIYGKCFPTGNAKEFCNHVFRTFDSDKNGVIDFKEFLVSINVTSSGSPKQKLNWAFSMYDVDGNGYIDLEEMTKLVSSIYKMVDGTTTLQLDDTPLERAQEIFTRMDVNSDGKVTKEEFTKTCLNDKALIGLLAPNL